MSQIRLTTRGKSQEKRPIVGLRCKLYIASRNWPSLGITPDKPEYGIRYSMGAVAFSQDKPALLAWAKRNDIDLY